MFIAATTRTFTHKALPALGAIAGATLGLYETNKTYCADDDTSPSKLPSIPPYSLTPLSSPESATASVARLPDIEESNFYEGEDATRDLMASTRNDMHLEQTARFAISDRLHGIQAELKGDEEDEEEMDNTRMADEARRIRESANVEKYLRMANLEKHSDVFKKLGIVDAIDFSIKSDEWMKELPEEDVAILLESTSRFVQDPVEFSAPAELDDTTIKFIMDSLTEYIQDPPSDVIEKRKSAKKRKVTDTPLDPDLVEMINSNNLDLLKDKYKNLEPHNQTRAYYLTRLNTRDLKIKDISKDKFYKGKEQVVGCLLFKLFQNPSPPTGNADDETYLEVADWERLRLEAKIEVAIGQNEVSNTTLDGTLKVWILKYRQIVVNQDPTYRLVGDKNCVALQNNASQEKRWIEACNRNTELATKAGLSTMSVPQVDRKYQEQMDIPCSTLVDDFIAKTGFERKLLVPPGAKITNLTPRQLLSLPNTATGFSISGVENEKQNWLEAFRGALSPIGGSTPAYIGTDGKAFEVNENGGTLGLWAIPLFFDEHGYNVYMLERRGQQDNAYKKVGVERLNRGVGYGCQYVGVRSLSRHGFVCWFVFSEEAPEMAENGRVHIPTGSGDPILKKQRWGAGSTWPGYVVNDANDTFNNYETNPVTPMDVVMGVGQKGKHHFGNIALLERIANDKKSVEMWVDEKNKRKGLTGVAAGVSTVLESLYKKEYQRTKELGGRFIAPVSKEDKERFVEYSEDEVKRGVAFTKNRKKWRVIEIAFESAANKLGRKDN